jgi:ADP-ribose pyrophosphatase YjhB (NUDIX family)
MQEIKEIIVGVVQNNGQILIIKRAAHNKYDPERWEFVSVFVKEPKLEQQAAKQVKSETGLEVKLVNVGKVFEVNDEYGKWLIHPFRFEPITREVKVDQDHTDFRWITPEQLGNFECVKDLDKNMLALG